jgi:serine/threonine-protein phosphatase 2A activator
MKPKALVDKDVVEHYAKDYMFLGAVAFIHQMKRGPFHEHSPMLYDISAVPSWHKVNVGLIKMYYGEVLEKFPVVQHFEFGTLLPWE